MALFKMKEEDEKNEKGFKVLVVGDVGTGKTSFIKRYVRQYFSVHYKPTIGADFALKVINWNDDLKIKLQFWDIAGQERYGSMTRVYYKEAAGAFIAFDVTRAGTLEAVERWKDDLDSKILLSDGSPLPAVLLANKCDLDHSLDKKIVNNYCKEKGFAGWFETSAKRNTGVKEAVRFLVNEILENEDSADKLSSSSPRPMQPPPSKPPTCRC